jgi:hypothetical protein
MGRDSLSASDEKAGLAVAVQAAMLLRGASPKVDSAEHANVAQVVRRVVAKAVARDAVVVPAVAQEKREAWRQAMQLALVPVAPPVLQPEARQRALAQARQQRAVRQALEPVPVRRQADEARREAPRLARQALLQQERASAQQQPTARQAYAARLSRQHLLLPCRILPSLPRPLRLALVPESWRVLLPRRQQESNWNASSFLLRRNRAEGQ